MSQTTDPVLILTMKWGSLYGAEYVNRLYAGVARNLKRSFRFICMTDDASGLRSEVEAYPLPDMHQPKNATNTRWRKLMVFQRELFDLEGTALFLDLDVAIVGPLDDFFDEPGSFPIIRDDWLGPPKPLRWLWPKRAQRLSRIGNTSVFRFRLGAHAGMLDVFHADPEGAVAEQPNGRQQEFVTEMIYRAGELSYWPRSWCVGFKYQCVRIWPLNYWLKPRLPRDARVVVFAGNLKPSDAVVGGWHAWYRRILPAAWLQQAWLEDAQDGHRDASRPTQAPRKQ